MEKEIAILATLDTKGQEAAFVRDRLAALGSKPFLVDLGVTGSPAVEAEHPREEVARAGGRELAELLRDPTREAAAPVMSAGATALLLRRLEAGRLHGVLGLGGLQGTAACTAVMRALPYGLPKLMVSTVASGDTAPYVGVKDVTMMFSVGDILGLNVFTRKLLANAAGAVHGMALIEEGIVPARQDRPLVGVSNLGVLTRGTILALEQLEAAGYEAVVFHAVGSGGRAMEQLMEQGVIGAVFDYAMGEITDALFGGLRAGPPERLTVAGRLGLPQVLCPGGAEHVGILVDPPHSIPERWSEHAHVFHNPVVFVPRLRPPEMRRVAQEIKRRLANTRNATLMLPLAGTGSYARVGGPLHDPDSDRAFFDELRTDPPPGIELIERDLDAEAPAFVREAIETLIERAEGKSPPLKPRRRAS